MENTQTLVVKDLTKKYNNNEVLHSISFSCKPGRIVALVGENGSGKTTIMKSILGLINSQGEIFLKGEKISFNKNSSNYTIGSLIEEPAIYPYLSGFDHLRLFSHNESLDDINHLIKDLNMTQYIHKNSKNYSLGMKQKLGIALAFLNDPALIILDEPMNGLDSKATVELRNLILKKSTQGVSFLISSHILSELQKIANDILIIDGGKIIKDTTMTNLLRESKQFITIKTTDDVMACKYLEQSGYFIKEYAPLKVAVSSDKSIKHIINLLMENEIEAIEISDVSRGEEDLESSVLDLIYNKERVNK